MPEQARSSTILEEAEEISERIARHEEQNRQIRGDYRGELLLYGARRPGIDPEQAARLVDTRVNKRTPLITPRSLVTILGLSPASLNTTERGRCNLEKILDSDDRRLAVVAGPCSIHDPEAALEYAAWIKKMRAVYGGQLEIFMRLYLEKPRTTVGWKGFLLDPRLTKSTETHDTNLGLVAARILARRVTEMGVPLATERLDTTLAQHFNALFALDLIGARNATDTRARAYASATSSPAGIKHTPDGNIQNGVDAVEVASKPNVLTGPDLDGGTTELESKGNPYAFLILRGGQDQQRQYHPNYSAEHVEYALNLLATQGLRRTIGIDASHANSCKDPDRQIGVVRDVAAQMRAGSLAIVVVMIESNLVPGHQDLTPGMPLAYGRSITDGCVGLEETQIMFDELAKAVKARQV